MQEVLYVLRWRKPIKRSHREVVVSAVVDFELQLKVRERVESVCSIEVFIVLSVRPFDLAVMSRCMRFDELVPYATLFETRLKQCGLVSECSKSVCELGSVICLYALYFERKRVY